MRKITDWSIFIIGIVTILFVTSVWAAYNLAADPRVYQYSNYKARKSYPVTLQIKVVQDNRPEHEKLRKVEEHPYTYDGLWSGLVDEMLEKVLEKELRLSGMAQSVDRTNHQSHFVLLIELNSFHGRWETGPQSFKPVYDIYGNTEFSARLISRQSDKVLFKKNYVGRTKAQVSQFRNKYAYCVLEAGKAFKEVAVKLMKDVETALPDGKVSEY